jgi:hypothetical protein
MIGPIPIEKFIELANYIIFGKVQAVISVEGVRVARVEVMRTLKGTPVNEIYYLAQSTWTCDISEAEIEETALFFFANYQFSPVSREFEEPIGFKEQVVALTNGSSFQQILHAGRGRMPLRIVAGEDYLTIWTGDVILPKHIKTIPGPEPAYDFIQSVSSDEIVAYTEKILR